MARKRKITRLLRRRRPLRAAWRYFRHGDTKRERLARARAIFFIARHRQAAAAHRAHVANFALTHNKDLTDRQRRRWRQKRAHAWGAFRRWGKVRRVYKRQQKRLRKRIEQSQNVSLQPWMLSGHSGPIDEKLAPVIVFLVGSCGQTITDTYDCHCHAGNSYHYPWNAADRQCHAVDAAGGDMCGASERTRDKFGAGYFAELLCPCYWHIFSGAVYSGQYPNHGDHIHAATPR